MRRRIGKLVVYLFAGLLVIYAIFAVALVVTEKTLFSGAVALDALRSESTAPHQLTLLDRGVDSLQERLKLIRLAKKTVELEFFIFDIDSASQLMTQELIKKAKEGVAVRLLVDFSLPVFKLKPAYAKYLLSQGVQIKYYNTSPIYRFISAQHRSHRKLLIVDDERMITGGRNVANDYFDLSTHYNFIDSDVLVVGEIVKTVRAGFDAYFNSDLAEIPDIHSVTDDIFTSTTKFFEENETLNHLRSQVAQNSDPNLKEHTCSEVTFLTDPPARGEDHRQVFDELVKVAQATEREIYIESPYLVLRSGGYDVFKDFRDRGVKVTVLTNSLHSTDAAYAIGPMILGFSGIKSLNMNLFVMSGSRPEEASALGQSERWGIHAKRAVIDRKHVLIGTYNIDPRSANLNSELLLICRNNPELAEAVLKSGESRMKSATAVFTDTGTINPGALIKGAATGDLILLIVTLPLAMLFDFLL